MDTIDLCKVYGAYENPRPYIDLENAPAPAGCEAWIKPIRDSGSFFCGIKINCHKILGLNTEEPQNLEQLRTVVSGWLACAGFCLDDFSILRIDYDYNFYLTPEDAEALIDTMQQLSPKIQRMNKWYYPESVYYANKSRHVQFYPKDRERAEKGFAVEAFLDGLCRQEVQCHPARIKYIRHEYGIPRKWDNWVTHEMEEKYLIEAEPIFQSGDFYSLERAVDLIQASDYTPCYKQRLQDALTIVHHGNMDDLKTKYSRNTLKKYLEKLKELNISPLPIPPNEYHIDYIENPFFKRKGI